MSLLHHRQHPVGETPFERDRRVKEEQRVAKALNKRRGIPSKPAAGAAVAASLSADEMYAEQLSSEIRERTDFLRELQSADGGQSTLGLEKRVRGEIAERVAELKRVSAVAR